VRAGVWVRKIWTSFVPRPGAASRVPYDTAALAHNPSLTWIGHASFLVRMDGVTFLTDPIFSKRAGPVPFAGPRRLVPPGVPLDALPPVDFALLSHDHYDHADLASVRQLAEGGVRFVVPLGLGDWVREAGGEAIELDWWQEIDPATFRKRLSRARQRVREFMRGHCGLLNPDVACSCPRRVAPAVERGRVDPTRLLFAGRGESASKRLPVLEAVGEMEHFHAIAAIHQSHPLYRMPEHVTAEIKRVLQSTALRIL
jgi:hypothetical protein